MVGAAEHVEAEPDRIVIGGLVVGEVFGVGEIPQGAGQHLLRSGYRRSLVDVKFELGDGRAAGCLHDEGAFSCGLDKDTYGGARVWDRSEDVARVDSEGAQAKLPGRRVAGLRGRICDG